MNSVITLPASEEVNVSSVQISTLHNFCSPYFFSASKPKGGSNIKTFIENRLPVKSNQIHGFATCLPPRLGGLVFILSCVMLDSSDLSITYVANGHVF